MASFLFLVLQFVLTCFGVLIKLLLGICSFCSWDWFYGVPTLMIFIQQLCSQETEWMVYMCLPLMVLMQVNLRFGDGPPWLKAKGSHSFHVDPSVGYGVTLFLFCMSFKACSTDYHWLNDLGASCSHLLNSWIKTGLAQSQLLHVVVYGWLSFSGRSALWTFLTSVTIFQLHNIKCQFQFLSYGENRRQHLVLL